MTSERYVRGQRLVPALWRGIRVLELLATTPRAWTLTEIAQELDIAKSSVHGLCTTLADAGLIERGTDGGYRLGVKVVDLANARLRSTDLPTEFYSIWGELGAFRSQAAVVSVRDGADSVYVACRNSTQPLGVTFRIGMRLPACCTATGKAFLSTLPEEAIHDLYTRHDFVRLTDKSVADASALVEQLREVRARGYSIDDGETREHMCSFGAPVYDQPGDSASAGVAISYFKADLTPSRAEEASQTIRWVAKQLSRRLGGTG